MYRSKKSLGSGLEKCPLVFIYLTGRGTRELLQSQQHAQLDRAGRVHALSQGLDQEVGVSPAAPEGSVPHASFHTECLDQFLTTSTKYHALVKLQHEKVVK